MGRFNFPVSITSAFCWIALSAVGGNTYGNWLSTTNSRKVGDFGMSERFSMDGTDWKNWGINFLRFVAAPTAIAFLTALQGGMDMDIARGVALGTGYTSVVDLIRKWSAGK